MLVNKLDYLYRTLVIKSREQRNETVDISDEEYAKYYVTESEQDDPIPGSDIPIPGEDENEHDYSKDYLTFEALEDGTFSFNSDIEYKYNDNDWTSLIAGLSINVYIGDIIQIKYISNFPRVSSGFIKNGKKSPKFNVYGNVSLSCNMLYKLFYDSNVINAKDLILPSTLSYDGYCSEMFAYCTLLVTAPKLPATVMRNSCYRQMFSGCTSLTTAPALPATTLNELCYNGMFSGCTSLTSTPELPATTLADNCYFCMFSGCTSLTSTPKLPATILVDSCYGYMFSDCILLTTAPELPATTLASYCYDHMFSGCTSLTAAPELPATTLADSCYQQMFSHCTSLTTAPELPATTLADSCYSDMFWYCTALTTVPNILPATTLIESNVTNGCYFQMFMNCSSLKTAPELPATILVSYCYHQMFDECISLNYIKCLANVTNNGIGTSLWLDNVSSKGTFVKLQGVEFPIGESGIPKGWTVQELNPDTGEIVNEYIAE